MGGGKNAAVSGTGLRGGTGVEKARETTRLLLAQCLKDLVSRGTPFEKITIRDITDEAGLIRPTFYNHFQDKYELLEWIFTTELLDPLRPLMEAGMTEEAMRLLFVRFEADKAFYQRAFKIEGQNSFESIVLAQLTAFFEESLPKEGPPHPASALPTGHNIALYCANSLLFMLKRWALDGFKASAAEVHVIHRFMMTHSLAELLRPGSGEGSPAKGG